MGKYMRKAKITGEVAVMEVSHQSTAIGVRTRARSLALQRLQKPSLDSSSYLELRSRRLEKPLAKPKEEFKENPNPNPSPKSSGTTKSGANPSSNPKERIRRFEKKDEAAAREGSQEIEVSFGENVLEVESRNARETTPCSLIRDSETIGTPGSTTRPTNSAAINRRMQSPIHRNFPTTQEMEEFFASAERLQQRIFTEKYNFDPISDCPLPGRYEWVKLD